MVLAGGRPAVTGADGGADTEEARREGGEAVQLTDQPIAAAIGANLPISEPIGSMVVDIGGGTSESALLSLGGVVVLEAVRVGSFDIDAAIQTYVRREYGLSIGERTAEEIKVHIGSAAHTPDEVRAEVKGRELMSGLPKTVVLTTVEIRQAIEEPVTAIVESVLTCLSQAPPELAQDLLAQGICLVGGGSLLRGLDVRLTEEAGVPVIHVDTPMECVVNGAGQCIESFDAMRAMFMDSRR